MTSNKQSLAQRIKALALVGVLVLTVNGSLLFSGCGNNDLGSGGTLDPTSVAAMDAYVADLAINQSTIAAITYDSSFSFADQGTFSEEAMQANALANNFYKNGSDGQPIGIDTSVIKAVLDADIVWVDLCNGNTAAQDTLRAMLANDDALTQFMDKNEGKQVAFHRLDIGEIKVSGDTAYLITRENFSLALDGEAADYTTLYIYTLVNQGGELKISAVTRQP